MRTHNQTGGLIWVVSYPKSGNTWLRLALAAVLNGGELEDLNRYPRRGVLDVSRTWLDELADVTLSDLLPDEIDSLRARLMRLAHERQPTPALVKSHDQSRTQSGVKLLSKDACRAVIYLVRDPRDVVLSWSRHYGVSIDQAIEDIANPDWRGERTDGGIERTLRSRTGSWSDHCRSWLDEKDPEPLVQRFEDRLADPLANLRAVLDHCRLTVRDDVIERAVAATAFDQLSEMERRAGFSERLERSQGAFFTSGRAGHWRRELTREQATRVERDHGEVMARLGYD